MAKKHIFKFSNGQMVKHIESDYIGLVLARCHHLDGREEYCVGKAIDTKWIDGTKLMRLATLKYTK